MNVVGNNLTKPVVWKNLYSWEKCWMYILTWFKTKVEVVSMLLVCVCLLCSHSPFPFPFPFPSLFPFPFIPLFPFPFFLFPFPFPLLLPLSPSKFKLWSFCEEIAFWRYISAFERLHCASPHCALHLEIISFYTQGRCKRASVCSVFTTLLENLFLTEWIMSSHYYERFPSRNQCSLGLSQNP